jgi:ABC-type multidrug transport system fused ATPase/permease subunit
VAVAVVSFRVNSFAESFLRVIRRARYRLTDCVRVPSEPRGLSDGDRVLLQKSRGRADPSERNLGSDSALVEASMVVEGIQSVAELGSACRLLRSTWDLVLTNAHRAWTLERLRDMTHHEYGVDPNISGVKVSDAIVGLRVQHVTFAYPSRPSAVVFDDFCIPGDILLERRFVCLAGPSGSGKSTLLSLLLQLYEAEGVFGLTKKDGGLVPIPLSSVPRAQLRRELFGYVPQHPSLYAGTVAQNISMQPKVSIVDEPTLAQVRRAAAAAHCADFIEGMPEAYLTKVSPTEGFVSRGAQKLSGGQLQRLMIARALYNRCAFLLLDEPTANLDDEAKRILMDNLRALIRAGEVRGVLAVTHDAFLMKVSDEVIRCFS